MAFVCPQGCFAKLCFTQRGLDQPWPQGRWHRSAYTMLEESEVAQFSVVPQTRSALSLDTKDMLVDT